MTRTIIATLHKAPGIPGQYQIAHNPHTDKLFLTGSFNHSRAHGSATATIARLDPKTLHIEALAKLPAVPETRPGLTGQYQLQGAYGLALDNERNTVWVGGTSTASVAVYRQEDLSPVWNSLENGQQIPHPREIYIDSPGARAYITGMGGYRTVNLDDYTVQEYPAGEGMRMFLGPIANERARELYLPEIMTDTVWVIDLNTAQVKRTISIKPVDYRSLPVVVHGVEVDPARGELYVSAQGIDGRNSGVYILALTGEYLDYIPYGKMPTDILYDRAQNLLYVTDFGAPHSPEPVGGTVAIIDVIERTVLGEVQVAHTKPNHQVLLPDGSVIVADKAEEYPGVRVPFHIDPLTGEYEPNNTDTRTGEEPRSINADSVVSLRVQTQGHPEAPTVFTAPVRVLKDMQGLSAETLAELPEGAPIELIGAGWSDENNKDGYEVAIYGDDRELARARARAGHFGALLTVSIAFPEGWKAGQEHELSISPVNDSRNRTVKLPVRIGSPAPRPVVASLDVPVAASKIEFTGYPPLP